MAKLNKTARANAPQAPQQQWDAEFADEMAANARAQAAAVRRQEQK